MLFQSWAKLDAINQAFRSDLISLRSSDTLLGGNDS